MMKYSILSLIRNAFSYHRNWQRAWRNPEPKPAYDAVIVGGGGHGLATAYYLAAEHGMRNIAVLEKGWIGGGNTGRNTTIIRSNYLLRRERPLYDHAVKLWADLSQVLNYNVMYSQRGVMMLAHNTHDVQSFKRHIYANRLHGVDNEWLTPQQAKRFCPPLSHRSGRALPDRRRGAAAPRRRRAARRGGLGLCARRRCAGRRHHRRTARCWASAPTTPARSSGVETSRGTIRTQKVGVVAAGHTSVVMARAGLRMPLESFPLQALVSEPVKPVFPCVVMSNTVHAYISQSDKGELVIGAGTDQYVSYSQTGGLHIATHTLEAICELFPVFSRLRMLRNWGGIVDVTPDRSPIIGMTPVQGLYVNCGWGTGGFKATPGSGHVFAHTIAHGRAASDQRALHARPLPHRPAHRRGGRGRRRALRCCSCSIAAPIAARAPKSSSAAAARRTSPARRACAGR